MRTNREGFRFSGFAKGETSVAVLKEVPLGYRGKN